MLREHWEIIVGGMALLMTVWSHLKSWTAWLRGLVVKRCWIDSNTALSVLAMLTQGNIKAKEQAFITSDEYVRPLGKWTRVVREMLTEGQWRLWFKGRPVWIGRQKDAPGALHGLSYAIDYVRGTIDVERLIAQAVDWDNRTAATLVKVKRSRHAFTYHHGEGALLISEDSQKGQKYEVSNGIGQRFLGWRPEEIGQLIHARSVSSLSLPPYLLDLAERIKRWIESKKWYEERGIPHRRGFLLHGRPGTGKTSFVRAVAEEHDLPVHVMDLASLNNKELRAAWVASVKDAPCVILIEDIDAVFDGRESVTRAGGLAVNPGLTYDALLNCVDGVERHDGIMFVITTNHIKKVDEALLSRPGRIDHVVEFLPLECSERLDIARRIMGEGGDVEVLAAQHADATAAEFVNICCQRALDRLFEARPVPPSAVVALQSVPELRPIVPIKRKSQS